MIKITLISAFFWGLISSFVAGRQKRNAYLWFLIGSLFGAFGLGCLFFFRKKTAPTAPPKPEPVKDQPLTYWYYLSDTTRLGPMSFDALKKSFYEDKVTEETYVWNEDMLDWAKLKTLPIHQQLTT